LKLFFIHSISRGYDYHNVPAPWYQIKLLKIIALLGQDNQAYDTEKEKKRYD